MFTKRNRDNAFDNYINNCVLVLFESTEFFGKHNIVVSLSELYLEGMFFSEKTGSIFFYSFTLLRTE